jgi:putative ABC transport system permease protein
VIAEFALALPLLAGAGLAIHSFWNLTRVDIGIRTDYVLGIYLDSVALLKNPNQISMTAYYRRFLGGTEAVPGASYVCVMAHLPLDTYHYPISFTIAGKPAYANTSLRPSAYLQTITPDYSQMFGIRIVKRQAFTDADNASSLSVAMVDEVFASGFLEGVDPLQQRVVMELGIPGKPQNGPALEWQIVGVFHTVKSRAYREDNPEIGIEDHPEIDMPLWQMVYPILGIGVRTAEDPASMIKSIVGAVNAVESQAAIDEPRTMKQMYDGMLVSDRFAVILFASFAVVGLLLAAVGIHGVTAFSVAQRSHEIAVRMTLGDTRNQIVVLVVKEDLVLACVGFSLGLMGVYFVGREMQSILFWVGAIDFSTFDAGALVVLFAALLACYLSAQRATRIDPAVALRHE